jgi:hypothetical protein
VRNKYVPYAASHWGGGGRKKRKAKRKISVKIYRINIMSKIYYTGTRKLCNTRNVILFVVNIQKMIMCLG